MLRGSLVWKLQKQLQRLFVPVTPSACIVHLRQIPIGFNIGLAGSIYLPLNVGLFLNKYKILMDEAYISLNKTY